MTVPISFSWMLHSMAFIIASLCTLAFKERIHKFLQAKNMIIRNYAGYPIVNGAGLMMLFPCMIGAIPYMVFSSLMQPAFYLLTVLSLSLAGLVDDLLGDSTSKGLKGHAKAFLMGGFTTGGMKAVIGGFIGLTVSLSQYTHFLVLGLDVVLFGLCINLMNLLDLRPGRAIKGFTLMAVLLIFINGWAHVWILLPLVGALTVYIGGEFQEAYMLGDTGSNLMGGVLGLFVIRSTGLEGKIVLCLFLLAIHLFAEFVSLSKCIESIPVLRKLDRAGRKTRKGDGPI